MWIVIAIGSVSVVVGLVVARTLGAISEQVSELYERESGFAWQGSPEASGMTARERARVRLRAAAWLLRVP